MAGGVVLALVLSFLGGRFSKPARIEERVKVETKVETVTEWKERLVYVQSKDTKKHVETRTVKRPDGAIEIIKVEDSSADIDTSANANSEGSQTAKVEQVSESLKVTENPRPRFRLGLSLPPRYPVDLPTAQVEGDVRLVGTLWLGARYVHADKTPFRVALGAEF
jgi:hypothetical protein